MFRQWQCGLFQKRATLKSYLGASAETWSVARSNDVGSCEGNLATTIRRTSSTGARAPEPVSPHASVLMTGLITIAPRDSIFFNCSPVKGLSHINVFIAGAISMGLL